MLIPHAEIPAETLQSLLEDYATRDGTDDGQFTTLEERVAFIRKKIEDREVFITFNHDYMQCCLVHRNDVSEADIREWLG